MKDEGRAQFEEWLIDYFEGAVGLARTMGDGYADNQTHDMWRAYQAGQRNRGAV